VASKDRGKMSETERRTGGDYGFARRPQHKHALALPLVDGRLIPSHAESKPSSPESEPSHVESEAAPIEPVRAQLPVPRSLQSTERSDDDRWVVRTKARQPIDKGRSAPGPRTRRRPGFVAGGAVASENDPGFKRWFVLGLIGVVYITGFAGLWSMVQTFEDARPSSIVPTDGKGNLPPLDELIDVRDAYLGEPIIPEFRPEFLLGAGEDIANSGFQKRI